MIEVNSENSVSNIQTVENVLSTEEHKKILDYVVTVNGWHKQPWGVEFFNSEKGMAPEIADILDKVFRIAFKKCEEDYGVKLRVFNKGEVHLVRFQTDFYMNKHVDTAGDFAVIYYINDDYQGGEINFPWHELTIKPKANSFIMFPSNQNYLHEVLKNTGNRYSSTLWFNFKDSSYRGNINDIEGTAKTVEY
jgi:hypothetical protein